MEILANLGTLKDGRTALVVNDAYHPDYVIVSGYDPETKTWSGGQYFDGDLTAFSKAITDINLEIGYDRMKEIVVEYVSNDLESADQAYVSDVLQSIMNEDEIKDFGFDWALGNQEEEYETKDYD